MPQLGPPFVPVQGVINIRSVGGFSIPSNASQQMKPSVLYRSGDPSRITASGKRELLSYGLTKIFDLRTESERSKGTVDPETVEGWDKVQVVLSPVGDVDWKEEDMAGSLAKRLHEFETNELQTFITLYGAFMEHGTDAFRVIFEHLRDKPDEKCLVHCTAGKDRTGLVTAVLLMLLGVSDEDIIADYARTTEGLEPFLPMLVARFKSNAIYADNWKGTENMGSARPETMVGALDMIRTRFGGAEKYLVDTVGFKNEDLDIIRKNYLMAV